jgi:hypothetical protein
MPYMIYANELTVGRPFELDFISVEYLKAIIYKYGLLSPQGIGVVVIKTVEYSI